MRHTGRLRSSLAAVLTASLVGCATAPSTETPSPSPTAPPSSQTIVMALPLPAFAAPFLFFASTNAFPFRVFAHPELASRLVYNALFRYDDSLEPVPDLAAEPCDIAADRLTITCRLVEAVFP